MIYTDKGFGVVNKAEVDIFLELSCFFSDDPMYVGSLISGSSVFSNSSLHIWKFSVQICCSLAWNFEHYLANMWNECNREVVWTFFGIALLWDWNENWSFPVPWPLLNFPNLLAYWVKHFNNNIFRIWTSSAGIPSLLLALFVIMLP